MKLSAVTLGVALASFAAGHQPAVKKPSNGEIVDGPLAFDNGVWNLDVINSRVQQCEVAQDLKEIIEKSEIGKEESMIQRLFKALFPFGPAMNAILATTYISGPPNLLLALIPPNIDPSSLSTLVSFAVGGLLGDVFLHLLPQTFVGEAHDGSARFVLVDEGRNTILGLAMFVGFLAFVVLDKGMRIMSSGSNSGGHSHSHSHSHSHASHEPEESATSSAIAEKSGAKSRKSKNGAAEADGLKKSEKNEESETGSSVKLSAYLNLIADFTHNITDGLAIAASFYVSKNVGATTCLAVFFHEIPHEVGDFALLIQGGFSKTRAMQAQFITAIGAYLGTFIGIGVDYLASSSSASELAGKLASDGGSNTATAAGIFGTNVMVGDLTLPFTAGGFLYIATVGVIPEILESGEGMTRCRQLKQAFYQLMAMLVGIGIMFVISWTE